MGFAWSACESKYEYNAVTVVVESLANSPFFGRHFVHAGQFQVSRRSRLHSQIDSEHSRRPTDLFIALLVVFATRPVAVCRAVLARVTYRGQRPVAQRAPFAVLLWGERTPLCLAFRRCERTRHLGSLGCGLCARIVCPTL